MAKEKAETISESKIITCGLVMPISSIDGCSAEHWLDVKSIIASAIEVSSELKFEVRLVSDQDDVGVIQKRIVQNLYSSDIIVCDVSCKNPNVMFELGMRLAFDKPTVIIKDDHTEYSFDTSVIEHLTYPRDLRFSKIVTFKEALLDKVLATYNMAQSDPGHSTFLKSFGQFRVAELDKKVGSADEVILDMLQELTRDVAKIRRQSVGFDRGISNTPVLSIESEAKEAVRKFLARHSDQNPNQPYLDVDFERFIESYIPPWYSIVDKKRFLSEAYSHL